MKSSPAGHRHGWPFLRFMFGVVALFPLAQPGRADDPYARSRDYDLQNVRTHLWFDLDQKKIRGEVNHTLSVLRDDVTEIKFDCAELKIQRVVLDGKDVKFTTTASQLIVPLVHSAKRGERHDVLIRYEGQPKKGLYFILPDKDYPQQPKEIWTQGESEDTHFYIPIYDYPNDRTTSEMLLTVPGNWVTVSNGRLVGVKTEADGTKTWDWKQSEPLSTYLISAVAGEFVEKKDTWRGIPIRYVVPNGEEQKVESTFAGTKEMLDAFSDALGVRYPWAQYAQTSVDDFVVGGMENTSATTLTARGLVNPLLAPEERWGSDGLNSHELAHQWFGDLVTCKDWGNLWLNEGFATYFEHYWNEQHYGKDEAEYEFWRDQNRWFQEKRQFTVPIVTRSSENLIEYAGNIYTKGGLVLRMLREKLGDANFFLGLHAYLETNRGQNVVTADLQKALEQATAINVDQFFHQWVYRAGAPHFEVAATYDDAAHQVRLDVKQKQKVEGLVPLFSVPVDVEIATATGRKTETIQVSKASESFTIAAEGAPLMIVFDQGNKILKTLDFKRSPEALIYQLKNGSTVPDRAAAAAALADVKGNPDVVGALGEAVQHEPFWGVRAEVYRALGKIGGPGAEKWVLAGMNDDKPWAREVAAEQLGNFKDDPALGPKLAGFATSEKAYRVRAAALDSLAKIKAANAFDTLAAAAKTDSPDDVIRQGALHAFGTLEDDRAVPILLAWMAPGKPLETRRAAIEGIGGLDKSNKEITKDLISCLKEPYFDVKFTALFALGARGDADAIPALEALLNSGELSIGAAPFVQQQIAAIKAQASGQAPAGHGHVHGGHGAPEGEPTAAEPDATLDALKKLQQQMEEVNERLGKIESQLSSPKK
jgi:aminopeptidase N